MAKRVGIPRGMFYYKFHPMWKTFFEELGIELVVSDKTTRKIFDDGIKSCVDEACLPVKVFHGHVLNLKDRVDCIFIPRYTSISRKEYICPKFGGLPDMVRSSIKGLPCIIDTEINLRNSKRNGFKAAVEIGSCFGCGRSEVRRAYHRALENLAEYNACLRQGALASDIADDWPLKRGSKRKESGGKKNINIAVVGHCYNIYDSYVNMDMLKKLKNMGVNIITTEMVDEEDINASVKGLHKKMFWNFGRFAVGAVNHLLRKGNIDGILYIMSFGCGIDSFVCDIIERRIRREGSTPFMVLTIDEHSGEAGVLTRIEAFIDMIRWRSRDEGYIPSYGQYIYNCQGTSG